MDIENVTEIFCRLSGLDSDGALKFRFMCESALEHIVRKTRGAENIQRCGRFEFAAAALAYYRYVLWSMTNGEGDDISVGEISVKKSASRQLKAAEKLCCEAFQGISDIYEGDDFVFEKI